MFHDCMFFFSCYLVRKRNKKSLMCIFIKLTLSLLFCAEKNEENSKEFTSHMVFQKNRKQMDVVLSFSFVTISSLCNIAVEGILSHIFTKYSTYRTLFCS